MRNPRFDRYNDLSLSERAEGIAWAEQAGSEDAMSDNGAVGGIDQLIACKEDFITRQVERAWQEDLVDDQTFNDYWRTDESAGDPRIDAYARGWADYQARVVAKLRDAVSSPDQHDE